MLKQTTEAFAGKYGSVEGGNKQRVASGGGKKIEGTVVLMKKNVVEVADLGALVIDDLHELFGNRVSLQLVSARNSDSAAGKWLSPFEL